jgi:methylated-DNA-protein-cysteine methyltransferase related protein
LTVFRESKISRTEFAMKAAKSRSPKTRSANGTSSDYRAHVLRCIRALPRGKVSSYGAIAKAADWPRAARQVARILHQVQGLPWHRIVGAGGVIKLSGENAAEQKFRLQMEGVTFRGRRVNMRENEYKFPKKPTKKNNLQKRRGLPRLVGGARAL